MGLEAPKLDDRGFADLEGQAAEERRQEIEAEVAERIRADVEALRIEHDGRSFGVTTNIGLTELTAEDSGPREVMARADEGSYIAKSRGRNRVVVVPSPPAG